MSILLVLILFPVIAGIMILLFARSKKAVCVMSAVSLAVTAALAAAALGTTASKDGAVTLFYLTRKLPLRLHMDALGRIFLTVVSVVAALSGIFSFEYMKKEAHERRYAGFYLILWGMLNGLCVSDNLVTFYLFYELMTLAGFPLVLHTQTKEAVMAALKYLFYSLGGAYMVLFGFFALGKYARIEALTFEAGGILNVTSAGGHKALLLAAAALMILGFGVKAGMFPMHAWLTAAHPAAPAPISSLLSAVMVKAGVFGIIRVVFYLFGTDYLAGTWVQYTWLTLALITVLMGSALAYREKVFKKRLAYSTVSQASYILFGLALMQQQAFTGALLHVVFHAVMKAALFLTAGAIIYRTGKKEVPQYRGIGKEMPVVLGCFTVASLGLIGIPPAAGFVSKWYLAAGALSSGLRGFAYAGPIVLLISALLTAGYLFPIVHSGFLPGCEYDYEHLVKKEPNALMTVPLLILAVLTALLGMFPQNMISYMETVAAALMG